MQVKTTINKQVYRGLKGTVSYGLKDPDECLGILLGAPGSGKTYFFQENPDAYILNLDRASSSRADPKAVSWPEPGKSFKDSGVTYENILEILDALEDLSVKDEPRPKMIVIDSLGSLAPIMQDWVVRNAVKLGLAKEPVDSFGQLYGMAAYGTINQQIRIMTHRILNMGYGLWYTGHLIHRKIHLGETYEWDPKLHVSDGVFGAIAPTAEYILYMKRDSEVVEVRPKQYETQHVHKLCFRVEGLEGILKARGGQRFPSEITVPPEGGWSTFQELWRNKDE